MFIVRCHLSKMVQLKTMNLPVMKKCSTILTCMLLCTLKMATEVFCKKIDEIKIFSTLFKPWCKIACLGLPRASNRVKRGRHCICIVLLPSSLKKGLKFTNALEISKIFISERTRLIDYNSTNLQKKLIFESSFC